MISTKSINVITLIIIVFKITVENTNANGMYDL